MKGLFILTISVIYLLVGCNYGIPGAEVSADKVILRRGDRQMRILWCTPDMFRVSLSNEDGEFYDHDSLMVVQNQWDRVDFNVVGTRKDKREWIITSSALSIHISQENFAIKVFDKENNLITASVNEDFSIGYDFDGKPFFRSNLFPEEAFFGFGERMDFLNQRGKKLTLNVGRGLGRPHEIGAYNILEANYCPVPFFMSSRGYGFFFHNAWPSHWDMGSSTDKEWMVTADGGWMDFYFIYGPDFKSIIENYTRVTGRTPLMPRFALGLHVGTYSGGTWGHEHLTNQNYVVNVARKFREHKIPADILWLDSTWRLFGKVNGKGGTTFEWRQPGFPDPGAMFDAIYDLNFNMAGVHIRPRLDNTDQNNLLEQAQKYGFTYPEKNYAGDFLNFFDPQSVDWWWEKGLKPLADMGCMFVKTDEGSAFGRQGNELVDKKGPQGEGIPELHNLFPVVYAKAPYEKFQEYNRMRGMNHTREGFAGIQRYPFIFAGDWPSEWQYFAPVIRAGINIGLSGVGAWTHCMGGFERVADPELYIRWCQFGMFSPVAMLFGMEHPQYKEPWNYGQEALEIFTRYDRLRYRLIPYIYSSYYQMYQSGLPVMRALVLENPTDENTYNIDDQYMFGDNLMVCPVTTKGASTRVVYFPEGEWYDYLTGEKISGGQYQLIVTPIEKLPLFAKAGSIFPLQPEMEFVGEKGVDPLTLKIFPGEYGAFTLYEDDGKSLDYMEGKYSATLITQKATKEGLSLTISTTKGDYEVEEHTIVLEIVLEKKPSRIIHSGSIATKEVSISSFQKDAVNETGIWAFDAEAGKLFVSTRRNKDNDITISILY